MRGVLGAMLFASCASACSSASTTSDGGSNLGFYDRVSHELVGVSLTGYNGELRVTCLGTIDATCVDPPDERNVCATDAGTDAP